jgi:hypothetical protein
VVFQSRRVPRSVKMGNTASQYVLERYRRFYPTVKQEIENGNIDATVRLQFSSAVICFPRAANRLLEMLFSVFWTCSDVFTMDLN